MNITMKQRMSATPVPLGQFGGEALHPRSEMFTSVKGSHGDADAPSGRAARMRTKMEDESLPVLNDLQTQPGDIGDIGPEYHSPTSSS